MLVSLVLHMVDYFRALRCTRVCTWNEWYCIFWDEDQSSVINIHLRLCKCVLRSCFVWNTCSDVIPVDEISDIEMAWPRNAAILLSMHSLFWRETEGRKQQYSVSSLVGFRQGLSASQQYFPLTTNQHQPSLSAQKPTSEQTTHLMPARARLSNFSCQLSPGIK